MLRLDTALALSLTSLLISTAAFAKPEASNSTSAKRSTSIAKTIAPTAVGAAHSPLANPPKTDKDTAANDVKATGDNVEEGVQTQAQVILPGDDFVAPPGALYTTSDECA